MRESRGKEGGAMPVSSSWAGRVRRAATLVTVFGVSLLTPALHEHAKAADATDYSGVYVMDPDQIRIGARVPAFKARGVSGKEVDFEALVQGGRPVILAFWSRYCKSCVEKFSALVALQAKYAPQGLQVISVNTDGEYRVGEPAIKDFLGTIESRHKIAINFPVIYDDNNWIPHALGIKFLPTIIAVDAQGRVLDFYHRFDEADEAEIQAGIEAIVVKAVATAPRTAPATPAPANP
jgi:thiol-disulfide isomerase/thioredoxin